MKTVKRISFLNLAVTLYLSLFAIAAFSIHTSAAATATVPVTVSGTCDYSQANMVISLTNSLRKDAGLQPLVSDPQLTAYALQRAVECAFLFSHDHLRPDGSAWYLLNPDLLNGENTAIGFDLENAVQVVNAWRDSRLIMKTS